MTNQKDRRQELLVKWKEGILTYQECCELRDILTGELEQAEPARKFLILVELLGLSCYASTKKWT